MGGASAKHVDLMFPNRYLKAANLEGKEVPLTIERVEMEELQRPDGDNDIKPVVYFVEMQKRKGDDQKVLVLCKTTAMQVASHHGKDTAKWGGKKITLYPTMVKAFGEVVEAIRVKANETKKRGRR